MWDKQEIATHGWTERSGNSSLRSYGESESWPRHDILQYFRMRNGRPIVRAYPFPCTFTLEVVTLLTCARRRWVYRSPNYSRPDYWSLDFGAQYRKSECWLRCIHIPAMHFMAVLSNGFPTESLSTPFVLNYSALMRSKNFAQLW